MEFLVGSGEQDIDFERKKVIEDIENFSFNTSVSTFMIAVNELSIQKCNSKEVLAPLLILLSPYAPHISEELLDWAKDNLLEDELVGALIVEKALSAPLRKIASNAGQNGAVILERVRNADFEVGYNAATNELVNMFDAGIIDPAKVTRSTLQNAASIASMVLTTECIIVDKPTEENLA